MSDNGVEQAKALGRHLAELPYEERPEVVLGSPYVRASSTMEHALAGWEGAPRPVLDERLRERDLGLFDGMTGQGIKDTYPEEAARRSAMGSGQGWMRQRRVVTSCREFGYRSWTPRSRVGCGAETHVVSYARRTAALGPPRRCLGRRGVRG